MALRVLALHGFGQNASVFMEKRVKEITRKLRDILVLQALDAPHTLPYDPSLRGWWVYPPELWDGRGETIQALAEELLKVPDFEPLGFRESFEAVLAEWSRGGYDGILGFSQGAILAAALCCELHRRGAPAPRFAVLISGFGRPVPRGVEAYPPQAPLPMPSLHIWGLADDHIPGWASETLAGYFENPRVCAAVPLPRVRFSAHKSSCFLTPWLSAIHTTGDSISGVCQHHWQSHVCFVSQHRVTRCPLSSL
mmetsp:Transcript_65482/g.213165  ORF Transcript_65482/g.213165 Transcript_65482/m.213165 type:complete len:252 (-) Transcript_65482:555-1310(-)